jgi:ankyrin repeat protein
MRQFSTTIETMKPNRITNTFLALLLLIFGQINVHAADLSKFPLVSAFELAPEVTPEPVPLRWAGGWVLARVKINGADAGWFKIATGWEHSSIDPTVAARLKLQETPKFGLLTQAQQSDSPTKIFRADSLLCGQASAADVHLEGFDLSAMSQEMVKMYDEGISGVLGWDLLRTLPFLLDEPALQLTWQREAKPADGATRLPVTEKFGCPFIEATLGEDCKALAMVNTAGVSVAVQRPFLKRHMAQLWQGQVSRGESIFYGPQGDDDGLPVGEAVEGWPTSRWLMVGCGGSQDMLTITLSPRSALSLGEVQICYGTLRRRQVLFDGPGKALWLKPSTTVPEVTLANVPQPAPSAYLLTRALQSAIDCNDPVAVRALVAAGADLKGQPRQEPLLRACRTAAREAAVALIEAGVPVEPPPDKKDTPLLAACEIGDPVLIKMLLAKGADANRSNTSGTLPLVAVARSGSSAAASAVLGKTKFPKDLSFIVRIMLEALTGGNLDLAKDMLARIPEELRTQLDWSKVLEQTLLLGHLECAEWILKIGKPKLTADADQLPALIAAILPTRMEKTDAIREKLVTMLLTVGADPNVARKGVTPLLLAGRHGNAAIVSQLIAAGAKATAKDYKLRNALHRAADANQPVDVIAPLLKSGIDLEDVDSETELTALASYAMHGNREACRALLDAGAKPDGQSMFGPSPLGIATNGPYSSDEDALAVVKLLLEHGAKAGMSDAQRDSLGPLFGASMNGRASLIKPLVEGGAPMEMPFVNVTPLGWACAMPSTDTVTALLNLGANPRVVDRMGITPLCHAAAAGRTDNMKLLLDHGVSPDATDPLGVPPIWVAASCGQTRAVRLLLAAGAKSDAVHPVKKTTALEAARARHDEAVISVLQAASPVK